MIEVEIKVKISNPDEMRKEFKGKNGVYKCSLLHEDTYFNMPEGLRDFRKSDEALRIRKSTEFNRDNKGSKKQTRYFLTYKGAKLNSDTKTREELETSIEEGKKIKEILKILGFREIFTVKKERELYLFDYQNYHIEALIDFLPNLKSHFIEVECQTESEEDVGVTQEVLFNFLGDFGIKKEESIIKSYLELIMDKLKGEK